MLWDLFSRVQGFFSTEVLVALGVASVLLFVVSLVTIPYILVRLPTNFFDERYPRAWMKDHHPVLRGMGLVIKNVAGAVFFLAGLAMLVLPGQGLLTILIGISLLDFPGKRHLEARLIGQPTVFRAVNALRKKFGRLPLTLAPNRGKNLSGMGHQPSASSE